MQQFPNREISLCFFLTGLPFTPREQQAKFWLGFGVEHRNVFSSIAQKIDHTARGYWPRESLDGQTLYFAENSGASFTLHMASLNPTGTESPVQGMPVLVFVADWDIVRGGVYFFSRNDILTLNYFDFSTRKVRTIFKISGGGAFPGLSVSPDGRYILYPELDDYRSDIMLVESFH